MWGSLPYQAKVCSHWDVGFLKADPHSEYHQMLELVLSHQQNVTVKPIKIGVKKNIRRGLNKFNKRRFIMGLFTKGIT